MRNSPTSNLHSNGFAVVDNVLAASIVQRLIQSLSALPDDAGSRKRAGRTFARRNLLAVPEILELANSQILSQLVSPILGAHFRPVRGILFDKTPEANWVVPWHQDLSIAVSDRIDLPGFGPWSEKAGVIHVQPPVEVLHQMLTVRLHLDECDENNGPLKVIPGSHYRILNPAEIQEFVATKETLACPVKSGGALLMRPLLLHASSASRTPEHRRVIHLEYAAIELPGKLIWHSGTRTDAVLTTLNH